MKHSPEKPIFLNFVNLAKCFVPDYSYEMQIVVLLPSNFDKKNP